MTAARRSSDGRVVKAHHERAGLRLCRLRRKLKGRASEEEA